MKIGDVVIVESEYGTIERISLTYVVVKVLGSYDASSCRSPIFWRNHLRTGPEAVRNCSAPCFCMLITLPPLKRFVRRGKRLSPLRHCGINTFLRFKQPIWKANTVEVRILMSAQSAPQLFDLRCLVSGKILAFVQEQNPEIFPKTRYLNLAAAWRPVGLRRPSGKTICDMMGKGKRP